MTTRGTIYIVPNREKQCWDLVVKNEGNTTFGVTQNILKPNQLQQRLHDDHNRFGHGLLVNPGGVSHVSFPKGSQYEHRGNNSRLTIGEDCFIRVGLRGVAEKAVQLPPLDGQPIAIDIETGMRWYGGNPQNAQPRINGMANYARQASATLHTNVRNGDSMIDQIARLMSGKNAPSRRKVNPKGHVIIKAVTDESGKVKHWDLRFTNTGAQGFMGTAVFKGHEKNAGRGLESMAVPDKGSSAEQRIYAGKDYGIRPRPGSTLRLGVRGHSAFEVKLPRRGSTRISLDRFEEAQSKFQPEFFNKKDLRDKRREKIGRVRFYQNGKALKFRPAVYTGDEAQARSEFDPPRLNVSNIRGRYYDDDLGDYREIKSGWRISLEGTMPDEDERGELGFVPTFKINGQPAGRVFKRRAVWGEEEHEWYVERGSTQGINIENGATLEVDTGALGWSTSIKLPAPNAQPKYDMGEWAYREHKAHRWELEQALAEVD